MLSNGQLLTALDRRSNALADVLAKRGAQRHRVPQSVRPSRLMRSTRGNWPCGMGAVRTSRTTGLRHRAGTLLPSVAGGRGVRSPRAARDCSAASQPDRRSLEGTASFPMATGGGAPSAAGP